MEYTIKEVAEKTGLSSHALRYYDREGLTPRLKRNEAGIRKYSDKDMEWIHLICCLKSSGMSLQQIKEFMGVCVPGEENAEKRKKILVEHRAEVVSNIENLQKSLDIIDFKLRHYKEMEIFKGKNE